MHKYLLLLSSQQCGVCPLDLNAPSDFNHWTVFDSSLEESEIILVLTERPFELWQMLSGHCCSDANISPSYGNLLDVHRCSLVVGPFHKKVVAICVAVGNHIAYVTFTLPSPLLGPK